LKTSLPAISSTIPTSPNRHNVLHSTSLNEISSSGHAVQCLFKRNQAAKQLAGFLRQS